MKKFTSLILSLLMGFNVFAQSRVFKAIPSAEVKNFKVAETKLKQQSSAKANVRNYVESKAFYTTYDLQSNSYLSNRMYQLNDGSVGVVATMSLDEQGNFLDRGTGYNFYKEGNINASNDIPQVREEANATGEDLRTGWPSIAPYGAEGEILVTHNGNGLLYYTRAKAGEGVWNGPHAIPNPDGLALSWSRIVTTGTNNNTVHIFANANTADSQVSYYLRSTNLQNWDIQYSPLEQDNLHIGHYGADDYVVSANGNNIAVVYCAGFSHHVMLYESSDAGLTWESRMVWECPVVYIKDEWYNSENEDFIYEELYGPTHASVAIGNDGVAHIALGVGLYTLEPGGYYSLYYGMTCDGIAYWNSTYDTPLRSPQDDDLRNALRMWTPDPEDETRMFIDFTNFCALTPPHSEEGFNYFDLQKQYTGSQNGTAGDYLMSFGVSAYPAIAVDPAGNLAIAYSAPDVNRDELYYDEYGNPYYYRSIFVNYKPAIVDTWSEVENILAPTNMYSSSDHSQSECTFVSAVSTSVKENEFWFSCYTDDTPGFHSGSGASQDHITTGTINVFKFTPTEEIDDEPQGQPNQSLLFSYEGNYINPTTINITRELNNAMEIQFDLEVINTTDSDIEVVCEMECDPSNITQDYLCWGSCFMPGILTATNLVVADGGAVFNGHVKFVDADWNTLPLGTTAKIKYTFYDKNNPSEKYTFNVNFKYDTPQQQYRNVLIEEFTGRDCSFCPMGHNALNDISNSNPGKVFIVNVHTQDRLSPTSYPNLNIDVSTSYYNAFNNGYIPSVMLNRVGESVHPADYECSNLVSQQLSQLTEVNIDGKVLIDSNTRVAEITVELDYTSSSTYNTNYLTIMMLQDSILGSQSGSSYNPEQVVDGQYCHMHVLRDVITSTWGNAVSPTTAGTHIVKTYTYEIPEMIGSPNGVEVDLDNIYFLAFVAETHLGTSARPILNVDKLENVIDGETPELPHYWNPDPSHYVNNMTVITTIAIDGEEQSSLDLELGAFCGDEVRGSGKLQYVGAPANRYECSLMLYGNAGDSITFKLYDHATASILDLRTDYYLSFSVNGTVGTVIEPNVVNFTSRVAIEATANPAEGGTVTGAANYHIGDEVSLTATANEKYAFINWTVEGEEVYTENNYIFIVEGARNLVANFAIIATPVNLKAEATSISEINLTWDAVENALSYNVYQGAELLANVTETTLTVDSLEPNTEYCFTVTAVRNETESDKSEEACAKTLGDGIEELALSINIYPNPVEEELIIATEVRVEEIAIYDIYGRMTYVYCLLSTDFVHNINVADLEAGIYFVKVVTSEGNIVKRFIKN